MKCKIENCIGESSVYGLCRFHYYRSEKYRELDKKRYRNNLEYERERNRIKSRTYNPERNRQGMEYRTKIAESLGLSYTQFTHQLQKIKKIILQRDEFCIFCGDKAELVHHELERKDYPELTLIENNMIALCKMCHKIHHGMIIGVNE